MISWVLSLYFLRFPWLNGVLIFNELFALVLNDIASLLSLSGQCGYEHAAYGS